MAALILAFPGLEQELAKLQPELQQASREGKLEDGKQLSQIRAKSLAAIDALMLTDAPLVFPPGQLALAALRSGMKTVSIFVLPLYTCTECHPAMHWAYLDWLLLPINKSACTLPRF